LEATLRNILAGYTFRALGAGGGVFVETMCAGVFAIALLLLPTALHAQAEKRIALLIGNKDYKPGVGALTNPLNDIRIVGEALKAIGFEVLKPVENAQRSAMLIAIQAFAARLKAAGPDAVGFLYYSGHGIASAGENYLIPSDVDEPSTVLLSVQGVKQSDVPGILRGEAPNVAHYLVLDACCRAPAAARVLCQWGSRAACWWRLRRSPARPRATSARAVALCSSAGHRAGEAWAERPDHVPQRARRRRGQDEG